VSKERELSVKANLRQQVKPRSGGRSQKLPELFLALTKEARLRADCDG